MSWYAISIDIGVKNCGICVFDFITGKVVLWKNVPMCPGKYNPSNNMQYVEEFVNKHAEYFHSAAKVLIEKQMRCNMRIIEAILHTMFRDRTVIINPKHVKSHYGLSTDSYRNNKKRAVSWATNFVNNNATVFDEGALTQFKTPSKQDDMADALVMLMYYLDSYSNQISPHTFSFNATAI
jgi:hypothetical protein